MTRDEAFDKLVETVDTVSSGRFKTVEQALVVAGQALNYIMDNIQEDSDNDKPSS